MLKLLLWLKYLEKKKLVFLSIAAVALSSAMLIVVASLFIGFIGAFEETATKVTGDVLITPPLKFDKYDLFIEKLETNDNITAATATLLGNGLLHLGKSGNVKSVVIRGIDPAGQSRVSEFKSALHKQKNLSTAPVFATEDLKKGVGGFIGIGVIAPPDEKTDEYDIEKVESIIGTRTVLTTGVFIETDSAKDKKFKRKNIPFTVTDVVFSGLYELDSRFVYIPMEQLQQALYPNETGKIAHQVQIKLTEDANIESAIAQIWGIWKNFATEHLSWRQSLIANTEIESAAEMQKQFIGELYKQMMILLVILGIVSAGIVILISCIFYMIVQSKQKDIAIIKSCGATNGSVAGIFLGYGVMVGVIGSAIGMVLGYIVIKNINEIERWIQVISGLKLWKSSVYMFDKIPSEINWPIAWMIAAAAVIAAAIGALIPAIAAAKSRPITILRFE